MHLLPQRIKDRTYLSGDCWVWGGTVQRSPKRGRSGYGQITIKRKTCLVHRVVYELLVGPIPAGLTLDHLCLNKSCINPVHLEPVTVRENQLRAGVPWAVNALKTHCVNGHAFDKANTYVRRDKGRKGNRECRTCLREAVHRYQKRIAS